MIEKALAEVALKHPWAASALVTLVFFAIMVFVLGGLLLLALLNHFYPAVGYPLTAAGIFAIVNWRIKKWLFD